MAQRQKVGPISGTRAVSTPKATNIDIYAAPTKNNLGDLSNALNNLNPKLQAYGDKMKVDKDKADMATIDLKAQTFRAEHGAGVVDAVRAGELHPNLSTIVQSKLKERLGQLWVEDYVTDKIKLMNAQEGITRNSDDRNSYYESIINDIRTETENQPFFSNAALVKGKAMMEAREHNYLEMEMAEDKKIFTAGFTEDLTDIFLNPNSTPEEMKDNLILNDIKEENSGSMLNKRERKNLLVDSLISAAYAKSVNDPDGAAALLGSIDPNGNLIGSALPEMLGEANLHKDPEIKDKLIKAQLALVTAKNAKITANTAARKVKREDKANQIMNGFNEAVYSLKSGNSFIQPDDYIRKYHPELFSDPDFITSDIYSKFLEKAETRNGQDKLTTNGSKANLSIAVEAIKGMSFTGSTAALDPDIPIHAEILALFPDGNIDLNAASMETIASALSMNPEEKGIFIDNASKNVQASNEIRSTHKENFERKYMTNKIESTMEQLTIKIGKMVGNISDETLNMKGNITDLYDNFIYNSYINHWIENDGPPNVNDMDKIYKAAKDLVNQELKDYEKYTNSFDSLTPTQQQDNRPERNNADQTSLIGDILSQPFGDGQLEEIFGEDIAKQLGGAGNYEIERSSSDPNDQQEDGIYFTNKGNTFRIINKQD